MTISDEAVEAALYAFANAPFLTDHREQMKLALEAAAPFIRAEAKAEALEWIADDFSVNLTTMSGPRIREWIKARAAEMRQG